MKSFLTLCFFSFGSEASQDFQQLLASVRQLNKTFSPLAHSHIKRRLQTDLGIPPLPSGCAEACTGMQCLYDDTAYMTQQLSELPNAADRVAFSGDSFGVYCLHRSSLTCSSTTTDCDPLQLGHMASLVPCVCDACPNFPYIFKGIAPLLAFVAIEGTPSAEQLDEVLNHLCPMLGSVECLDANPACSDALPDEVSGAIAGLSSMKAQCATANKPTDYTTPYTFASPTGCHRISDSGAVGLQMKQFTLLAGFLSQFTLLSILN